MSSEIEKAFITRDGASMRSRRFYAAIRNRAHAFPLPPFDFDRFSASDDNLAIFGIPPKPEKVSQPDLRAFWDLLLSDPFNPIIPAFQNGGDEGDDLHGHKEIQIRGRGKSPPTGFQAMGFQGRGETSKNWSGYYIAPTRPARFRFMTGRWTVPKLVAPKTLPDPIRPDSTFKSTVWIGFDGHRSRYPHASLPQIGTSLELTPSSAQPEQYRAWWQWWMHNPDPENDPENAPVYIENMAIKQGDDILACMQYLPFSHDVHFVLKNQKTGQFCAFIVIAPGQIDPIGTTAEWVVERPTDPSSDRMESLPNYGSVDFSYCLAQSGEQLLSTSTTQTLAGNGRIIRMYETFSGPSRIGIVSAPKKLSPTSFRCSYHEPGLPRV